MLQPLVWKRCSVTQPSLFIRTMIVTSIYTANLFNILFCRVVSRFSLIRWSIQLLVPVPWKSHLLTIRMISNADVACPCRSSPVSTAMAWWPRNVVRMRANLDSKFVVNCWRTWRNVAYIEARRKTKCLFQSAVEVTTLSSRCWNHNGTSIVRAWLNARSLLSDHTNWRSCRLSLNQSGTDGWKTFATGASRDNSGGVIGSHRTSSAPTRFQRAMKPMITTGSVLIHSKMHWRRLPNDSTSRKTRFDCNKVYSFVRHSAH